MAGKSTAKEVTSYRGLHEVEKKRIHEKEHSGQRRASIKVLR